MPRAGFVYARSPVARLAVVSAMLLAGLAPQPAPAEEATVSVPVRLQYPLLQKLLERELFGAGQSRRDLLDDPSGCARAVIANPRLSGADRYLTLEAELDGRLGMAVMGQCNQVLAWQGGVGLAAVPVIAEGGTAVHLDPQSTWLIDPLSGTKITSGPLWQAADNGLRMLMAEYRLDLKPQLQSLKSLLPEMLAAHNQQQLQDLIDSMRLGQIEVTAPTLDVLIDFEVDELPVDAGPEAPLEDAELARWEERWQAMDALLVLAVKHYASATGLEELRDALLDILIDSRYRLRDLLAEPATGSGDAVRTWFLDTWRELSPVIRQIGLEQPGQEDLLWFSVVTATDALYALDRLGPSVGLDISVSGLRRLARLINDGQGDVLLQYGDEVDPELQRLYRERLTPPAPPSAWRFRWSPVASAWAAAPRERLNNWVPKRSELDDYLPAVAGLLDDSTTGALSKHSLVDSHRELYRKLVLTTAWQESCWRQYVVQEKKLKPLRSGTGDVGLMQINERVWRGFYDMQRLRWDIDYNGQAGAEILLNYLVKYALRKGEHLQPGGLSNLARASYSAYNGGPRQVSRYRRSDVSAYGAKVDQAFWSKYQEVAAGNEMGVAACLGGSAPPAVPKRSSGKSGTSGGTSGGVSRADPAAADSGARWAAAQAPERFTLQLAAFSKRELARDFIARAALSDPTYIFEHRQSGGTRFLVLQGSFATRGDADRARRQFKSIEPWPRRFAELR